MKPRIYFLFVLIVSFSCSKSVPRKPINPKPSTTIFQENIAATKQLIKNEEYKILEFIKKDSTNIYLSSKSGFWYTYQNKIEKELPTPKTGDDVTFTYTIKNLNDSILYSKEELGVQNYRVDKEDFISGIQRGIKLMKIGETITFVIPSYNAFGVSGDGNKIGVNKTIKTTVTLINIK